MLFVVQSLSHVWLFVTPWTKHARLPCPSLSPRVCSNSCSLSWWCHPTISSSVTPLQASKCRESLTSLKNSVQCLHYPQFTSFKSPGRKQFLSKFGIEFFKTSFYSGKKCKEEKSLRWCRLHRRRTRSSLPIARMYERRVFETAQVLGWMIGYDFHRL